MRGVAVGSPLRSGNATSFFDNLPSLTGDKSAAVGGVVGAGYNLGAAAGGYLLYPNQPNNNSVGAAYRK